MKIKAFLHQNLPMVGSGLAQQIPLQFRTCHQNLPLPLPRSCNVSQVLAVLMLMGLVGCQPRVQPTALPAQVERIVSGQTLEIRLTNQPQTMKIRLWGIIAPDRQQKPWADTTYRFLVKQVQKQVIAVEFLEQTPDRYGRFLARVWVHHQLLNEVLIREGHALVMTHRLGTASSDNTQYDQRLVWAQQRARILGLGIWNPRLPMRQSPHEFRKQSSFLQL